MFSSCSSILKYIVGFMEEVETMSKNCLRKLWLIPFPESSVMVGDINCVSKIKLQFFMFSLWVSVQNEQKIGNPDLLWYQVYRETLSKLPATIWDCHEMRQFRKYRSLWCNGRKRFSEKVLHVQQMQTWSQSW